MKKIYIETTIPSFYFETRSDPEMIAMRRWTRYWWDNYSHQYEMVTSEAVFEELNQGEFSFKKDAQEPQRRRLTSGTGNSS
ncbi:MAG: hypothetical protein HQL20_01250 [Candidatus Omnitrophica bacterium]|nr:hypothetical protein [Candidatus Omnitrophota bacterium]